MNDQALDRQLANVTEAFNRKAGVYDRFGEDHPNLLRMRRKVREHVQALLPPDSRLLEINAGTGADAVYFARQGYSVLATDLSPTMVDHIHTKIADQNLESRLQALLCSFTHLDQINDGPFEAVFSNMGGLNCISDLQPVTEQLPRLLVPGGYAIWVIMPDVCLWELGAVLVGDFRTARRRRSRDGVLAQVEGVRFMTFYHPPDAVQAALGPAFRVVSLQGLSVFTPPADRKNFALRHPHWYRLLVRLDDWLAGRSPFNRWGDFYILTARFQDAKTNHQHVTG